MVVSHLLWWRVLTMHQTCQCLLFQPIIQIFGSPDGSGPDLDGMGNRSTDAHCKCLRDMLGLCVRGLTNFENHVKTISDAVCLLTSRITNVEQIVSALSAKKVAFTEMEQNISTLTARMCKFETSAFSGSSASSLARSWPSPGQVDGSTAAGVP